MYLDKTYQVQPVGSWLDDAAMSIWGDTSTNRDVAAAQSALIEQRRQSGAYTQQQADQFQTEAADAPVPDYSQGTPSQAFNEGLSEGFQAELAVPGKVVGYVGQSVGTLGGGILRNLPWWVYVGGGIVALVYLAPMLTAVLKLKSER